MKLPRIRSVKVMIALVVMVGGALVVPSIADATPLNAVTAVSTSSVVSHPVLRNGSRGADVQALQGDLNAHGAHLTVDGAFGPATLAAVKSFQSAHGLAVDGIVGAQTWGALEAGAASALPAPSAHSVLHSGARGPEVVALQTALTQHGIPVPAVGSFGPVTLAAVKSLQARYGLVIDGIVGPNTWRALGLPSSVPSSVPANAGVAQVAINAAAVYGAAIDLNATTHMLHFLQYANGTVYVSRTSVVSFGGCNVDGCGIVDSNGQYHSFDTPNGVFHLLWKAKGGANERSAQWNNALMPWALYYTGSGMAVHQDPLENSHGCTHVPDGTVMKYMYDTMPVGGAVVKHD